VNPAEMRVSLEGNEVNCYPATRGKNSHQSRRKFRQQKATFMKILVDLNPYLMQQMAKGNILPGMERDLHC